MRKLTLANLPPEEKILSELVKFRRTGVFTLTLTELLETKRQEYGLSIRDTVVLLCITPQTYYNWWNGLTRRCNMMHRDRIIRFISGQLDYLMRSQQSRPSKTDLKNIDWQFAHVYKFRHQTRQLIKLFPDSALKDMAAIRPVTWFVLLTVPDLSIIQGLRWGRPFLKEIRHWRNTRPATGP